MFVCTRWTDLSKGYRVSVYLHLALTATLGQQSTYIAGGSKSTVLVQGLDAARQSNLLPHTPRSIMKRNSPFTARRVGAVMLTSTPS